MSKAVLLTNGRRIYNDELVKSEVLIVDGKIKAIGEHIQVPSDAEKVDLDNGLITPGLIDIHVHLRDQAIPIKKRLPPEAKPLPMVALRQSLQWLILIRHVIQKKNLKNRLIETSKLDW